MANKTTRTLTRKNPKETREMGLKNGVANPVNTTRVLNPRNQFAEVLNRLINAMR
jgi:hypothetical protein